MPREGLRRFALAAGLAGLVLAVYARTVAFGFVNLDDAQYVYENPRVMAGLGRAGAAWAFATFEAANWHPLTWISHMIDVDLFGGWAGGHHLVNALLHAANTVLVFGLLRSATGATWRSALAAALFGAHPIHVESVAWVSERKDVLSTAFLLLALRAHVAWARTGRRRALLATPGLLALGLLCKPMLVTAPFLLLLLDAWPLGRIRLEGARGFAADLVRLLPEKAPSFLLAAAASAVTWLAQSSGGGESAVAPFEPWPRVANAVVSYARYLGKAIWPSSLASFYPHPATIRPDVPVAQVAGAALLVLAVTAIALRERRRRPYLAWGWFWYLGALVPVIGLVQVGGQAMADRYTYVPLLGPFVALAWGAAETAERWRVPRAAIALLGGAVVLALAAAAWRQVGFWRDSVTLHERSLAVTDGNWKAWQGLCSAKRDLGRLDEALPACRTAVAILPTFPEGWDTLGVVVAQRGAPAEAVLYFQRALSLRPDYFLALKNLGSALGNLGQYEEASARFREALALRPDDPEALGYLALSLSRAGDRASALATLERLRPLDPARAEAVRRKIAP